MEFVPIFIGVAVCAAAVWAVLKLRPSKHGAATTNTKSARIDPFTIGEPWRRHIASAQSTQRRYAKIVSEMQPGPLRTRLAEIGLQVDRGVIECWEIAKRGDRLDDTIRSLDGAGLRAKADRAADPGARASLQSQLSSLDRIRSARDQTDRRLHALQAQLGEIVSRAAVVSAGVDTPAELGPAELGPAELGTAELGSAVTDVVVQLEALSQAVDEVTTTGRSRGFEPGPATPTTPTT